MSYIENQKGRRISELGDIVIEIIQLKNTEKKMENITVISIKTPNKNAPKYLKQEETEPQREMRNDRLHLNISLSPFP